MSAFDDYLSAAPAAAAAPSFDAYLRGASPAPVSTLTPQADRGATFGDLGSAFLHNVQKPFHGLAQLVENGVAAGASKLPDNPLSRAIVSTAARDNAAQQQWEQQYQQRTPDNAASYTGAVAGQVLPFLVSGVTRGLQGVGDLVSSLVPSAAPKVIPKVVSGITQGTLISASNPVDNGGDFFTEKGNQLKTGATIGGALPVVGAMAGGIRNAALPLVNPNAVVRNALQKWGLDANNLNASELVPGSKPTTAQLAGNPAIVGAEKTLFGNPAYKPLLDARNNSNNDARLASIGDVAQTPEALTAAISARRDATKPLQQALLDHGNPVPAAPILAQLDSLSNSALGVRPVIGNAAKDITAQIKKFSTVDPATGSLTIGPAHLDSVRQNVKEFLAQHSPSGAVGTQEQAAFDPVRNAIVDSIEGANPGYRNYLETYAKKSVPINTMEAGQSILGNLDDRAANSAGAPQVTLSGFNTQLKQAANRPYGIAPEAQASLDGVQADLQRATISNSLRVPGSDTSYNLQAPGVLGRALYGSNFQGGNLIPALMGTISGAAAFTHGGGIQGTAAAAAGGAYAGKKLASFASGRVNDALAKALLDPEVARGLLAEIKQNPRALQGLLSRVPQASLLMGNSAMASQPLSSGLLQQR